MRLLRSIALWRNQTGSIAVTTAFALAAVASFGALTIDTGTLYNRKRQQQGATDLAALAAAASIGAPATAASASVTTNGYLPSAISKIELGTYAADPSIAASARFTPQTYGTPNAVRLTMQNMQPLLIGSVAGLATGNPAATSLAVTTQSIAATRNVAAFSLGSGLASLDAGVLNSVLSSLTGSTVSLSLADYQALAQAKVNLFTFSNALAVRTARAATTYASLAAANVSLPTTIAAVADAAVASSGQVGAALGAIIAAVGTSSSAMTLKSLVNYGPYGTLGVGSVSPITASVSALDLVSALLQAANGKQQVETALAVGGPIAAASLKLVVGEPPVGSSLMTLGPQGTTLTTAQTRLRLSLKVAGPPPTSLLAIQIAINIAPGTATLSSLQCTGGDPTTASVKLAVTPGLVDAWIGTVSDQDLLSLATPLNPPAATFANVLGLVTVTGRANAGITNTSATTVPFTYTDITTATRKTVSTTNYLAPLLSSLFNNLQLNVNVLGYNAASLQLGILQALAADVTPIDSLLASTLTALGVSVGNATVWASGVQCGQAVLVN